MNQSSRVLVAAIALMGLTTWTGCGHPPKEETDAGAADAATLETNCTITSPCALQSGTAVEGVIGTKGQVNIYSITVPADEAGKRPIIQILLDRTVPVSAVNPVFTLTSDDNQTVFGTYGPAPESNGPVHLSANFLVMNPGTYLLSVHDVNETGTDPRNPYTLTANIFDDPDKGEPDDTVPMARPVTLGTPLQGWIAFSGDHDLAAFQVSSPGLFHFVLSQGASGGPLTMQMRILQLSTTTPNDLITATAVAQYAATGPGTAFNVDVIRMLDAGSYVVELLDAADVNSDATPAAQWTLTLSTATELDPGKENGANNQTAAGATLIAPSNGTTVITSYIAFQGDHDWYHIAVPSSVAANIVQVNIDPMQSNTDVQLVWAVGVQQSPPAGPCDSTCGPTDFCAGGANPKCGYQLRAFREYATGDTTPQVVRIREQAAPLDIYVLVLDQGDLRFTSKPYTLTVSFLADPDPNEPNASNDTLAAASPLNYQLNADGSVSYRGTGMISWWDYIDGVAQFAELEDLDWFKLPMPPLLPAQCATYIAPDAGPADGGGADGGTTDAGPLLFPDSGYTGVLVDGGCVDEDDDAGNVIGQYCNTDICPIYPDGGPVLAPRPYYGFTMHWNGPPDGTYKLGLQGYGQVGNKQGCLFSFDQAFAHSDTDGGYILGPNPQGYVFGNGATDPCFCLPAAQAAGADIWVRVEGPHRPIPPAANKYSDEAYSWELDMTPNTLQTMCNMKCPALTSAQTCP
jgi:hypothetical protein